MACAFHVLPPFIQGTARLHKHQLTRTKLPYQQAAFIEYCTHCFEMFRMVSEWFEASMSSFGDFSYQYSSDLIWLGLETALEAIPSEHDQESSDKNIIHSKYYPCPTSSKCLRPCPICRVCWRSRPRPTSKIDKHSKQINV